jgi:hypothetical protein
VTGLRDRDAAAARGPAFLITIDTEGDDIWSNPSVVTTENSRFLPRFQALCERYGLKPTYLTNYEMATCDRFVEFARDAIGRGTAEVGMHLHAWNSPPLTRTTRKGMPYLIEFPANVIADKVKAMTDLLEDRFGVKMVSHRAGRWAFNETYAKVLLDNGYRTDCSVTPHVSWRMAKGFEDGEGGTDYRDFPAEPYFIDPSNIGRAGSSELLEVPMTISANASPIANLLRSAALPRTARKAVDRLFPATSWFRPNGRNLQSMRRLLKQRRDSAYIEFMLHSSELMPAGSPMFPTDTSIDRLYEQMEQLFDEASRGFRGATLNEFRGLFPASTPA